MLNGLNLHEFERFVTKLSDRRAFIFSFILGFVIRLVPEILSYPHPIGFDTIFYAARIKSGLIWPHWTWVFSSWLLYAILIPLYKVAQIDPFLLLKLTAPTLYGLNMCGIYYFARKALNWNTKKSLIAASFFAFQLASLRISWDLYRNFLGLAVLLFILPSIPMQNNKSKKEYIGFAMLSTLVVFSHELVSVVMFAVFFGLVANHIRERKKSALLKSFSSILPALAIFLISLFLSASNALAPFNLGRNIFVNLEPPPTGLFFLVNYLNYSGSVQYPTYLDLVSNVLTFFVALYLLCLPLVLVGFFRDRFLDGWTILLLLGSFNGLIMPLFALNFWHRWMFMLVYPFTFYAANGVEKVLESQSTLVRPSIRWIRWIKVSRRTTLGILLLTVILGSFSTILHYGTISIPGTDLSVPSMYVNTVPLEDMKGTMDAINWLNTHLKNRSAVLVYLAFRWWVALGLNNSNPIIFYFTRNIEPALNTALQEDLDSIYFIWWNEDIGWYDLIIPNSFTAIFSSSRISVYQHNNTTLRLDFKGQT